MRFSLTDPKKHRWIMVSGAPRSGTTFVGTVLGMPRMVNTIFEPFNPAAGVLWNQQRYLYLESVAALSEEERRNLSDFFSYDFELKLVRSTRDKKIEQMVKSLVGGGNQLSLLRARLNPFAQVTLIKDPIAVFLAHLFADMRDVHTVFLIRHPLSFVGSLKRLGWRYKLAPLREQTRLLETYAPELAGIEPAPDDWVSASAWIWTAINRYVLAWGRSDPRMTISVHEAVSADPVPELRRLFAFFDLPWSTSIERFVVASSSAEGKSNATQGVVHDFRRSSADIFQASMNQLDADERRKVLDICWPVAEQIYAHPERGEVRDAFRVADREVQLSAVP